MFTILFIGKTVVTYLNANKKELLVHLLICKTLYFCGVLMKVSDDKLLKMERILLITGSSIMVFQIRNCLLYVDCFVNWLLLYQNASTCSSFFILIYIVHVQLFNFCHHNKVTFKAMWAVFLRNLFCYLKMLIYYNSGCT